MDKTITLKHTGFYVEGTARILCWDGDVAEIEMNAFHVDALDDIPKKVNDGQFGCQRILEADCTVYEDYEGTLRLFDILHYEGDERADAKKGVCVA